MKGNTQLPLRSSGAGSNQHGEVLQQGPIGVQHHDHLHPWLLGQEKVLGLPDTGGQLVYMLDQVRALEKKLLQRIKQQGLNVTLTILVLTRLIPEAKGTKCNIELEPVEHTKHSSILQVPFKKRDDDGKDLMPRYVS
uniref:sucrose synthase n=1 Tax=Aegilops tauschii subsp. strangulata TaxID=200361 RepID=A0A453A241_AEGTS